MSLKSERDNWETLAKNAKEKLISFMKESEHQVIALINKKIIIHVNPFVSCRNNTEEITK